MTLSKDALVARLATNETLFSAWGMWPSALVVEAMARSGFEAVLVDMQHGLVGFSDCQEMVSSIVMAGKPALVRIPVDDFAMASRALDLGAQVIVAPMINDEADAKAFVNAVKYPSIGERSFAPFRACQLFGETDVNAYVKAANRNCLALAMIETKEALDNLDAILAVEGIDGVFVGPADMSLTMLAGDRVDMDDEQANQSYRLVARKAAEKGKVAGIYSPDSTYAKRFEGYGYRLIAVGSDASFMAKGMADSLVELSDNN